MTIQSKTLPVPFFNGYNNNLSLPLDSEVLQWLNSMKDEDPIPDKSGKHLAYIIKPAMGQAYKVTPLSITLLKNGALSKNIKPYSLYNLQKRQFAAYITDTDQAILRMIHNLIKPSNSDRETHTIPIGSSARLLLTEMIRTGQCYWKELSSENGPLNFGDERQGTFSWKTRSDGMQKIQAGIKDIEDGEILPLSPLHYVSPSLKTVGIVKTDLPEKQTRTLILAPEIRPEFVKEVSKQLAPTLKIGKFKTPPSLLPTPLTLRKSTEITPKPCLKLSGIRLQPEQTYGWSTYPNGAPFDLPVGALSFDYDGLIVAGHDPRDQLTKYQDQEVLVIPRNKLVEFSLTAQLSEGGLDLQLSQVNNEYSVNNKNKDFYTINGAKNSLHKDKSLPKKWEAFVQKGIPELKKMGWTVEMDLTFPHNVVQPDEEWYAQIGEDSSGIDWFGIELGVTIEGQRLNLIPILLKLLKENKDIFEIIDDLPKDKPLMVGMNDGRKLALPAPRACSLLTTIHNLFTFGGATLDENGRLHFWPKWRQLPRH